MLMIINGKYTEASDHATQPVVNPATQEVIDTVPSATKEDVKKLGIDNGDYIAIEPKTTFTDSGFTARKMSRYRTKSMIIAATPNEQTTRALAINWGVKSVLCKQMDTRAAMIEYAQVIAKENLVEPGEQIIVTAGTPGVAGTTSYLELITVK